MKQKLIFYLCIIVLIMLISISGCSKSSSNTNVLKNGETLHVVVSTSIITDIVSNIAGDKAKISVLIGSGQDPHSYEPGPKDMVLIEKAHLIFVNGFNLEENLLEIIKTNAKASLLEVSKGVTPIKLANEQNDPHTWMSPKNVLIWVENIVTGLSELDPGNKEYYRNKADNYIMMLNELDTYINIKISSIPKDRRILVTDHDNFGYFARDYDFSILGTVIPAISTMADPSPKELSHLIEAIKEHKLTAIFIGSTAGDKIEKLGKTIIDELDYEIKILTLLTGSLSEKGIAGDNYLSYIKSNIDLIAFGLGE